MKDYTFGDTEYKKRFILNYMEDEKNHYLVAHLADGNKQIYDNNPQNEKMLLEYMEEQVKRASTEISKVEIDYTNTNILQYLKKYLK